MARPAGIDAVVLVDKPAGPSSAEVVDWVRWALAATAVGHCGTLDPAATGLLVVCVGVATKLAAVLTDADKRYAATFVLGRSTTTGDAEGEVVTEAPVDAETVMRAADALAGMVGELSLPPPVWSAVKIEGKRAHELARAGQAPELAPRPMIVRGVEAIVREATSVRAELVVSKGTYVRSLAEELGRRVGVPAHLGALRRLAAGDMRVDDPRALAGFSVEPRGADRSGKPRHRLRFRAADPDRAGQADAIVRAGLDPVEALPLPRVMLADSEPGRDALRRLLHGQSVAATAAGLAAPERLGPVAVVAEHVRVLLLARWEGEAEKAVLVPQRVVLTPPELSGASGA
jgi:tRNA pseudouridine55 synthase